MRLLSSDTLSMLGAATAAVVAGLVGLAGCNTAPDDSTGDDVGCRGACDDGQSAAHFEHRWAIDMRKVHSLESLRGKYRNSVRFVAAHPQELGLELSKLPPQVAPLVCQHEQIVAADGSVSPGQCLMWGNVQRLNFDHSYHVDDPANAPIINIIDDEGNEIDPPGYLNIIALLNADVEDQHEILGHLRNGDILVYFHPEDQDTTQLRMHHAAMYYETEEGPLALRLDGPNRAHHIDNPESYGPAFNAGVTSVPFHVFRLNPNGAPGVGGRDSEGLYHFTGPGGEDITITDEMADQYAYVARNWALITNDYAPFASFHDMSWNDAAQREALGLSVLDEVDRYALPALGRDEIPEVYCAGLVFTNLNLALNRPLNATALGPDLAAVFDAATFEVDDGYFAATLSADDLRDEMGLPSLDRLVVEPIAASDILDSWLETYLPAPLDPRTGQPSMEAEVALRQVRAMILDGGAERIAGGFRSLVWADTKDDEGREDHPVVATPERIRQYAAMYGQMPGADNFTLEVGAVEEGLDLIVRPGADGQPDLEQMKALEHQYVDNRYVPPPLYHVLANRPDSLLSYVGTVIHVDMLAPIGDNTGDTGSGEISEFREGGPDTGLYEHFNVPNGGRHVQRIIDVSSGPTDVGFGSQVSARISAADIRDVRAVLHPAGTFAPLDSLYACDREPGCLGEATPGIVMPLSPEQADGATAWDDVTVTWDLFAPVEEGGLGCVMAPGPMCPEYDWETGEPTGGMVQLYSAYGQWTMTLLDRGEMDEGSELGACVECPSGGAHSNQWLLLIRDDAPSIDDETPAEEPTDGEDWEGCEACQDTFAACDIDAEDEAASEACLEEFNACVAGVDIDPSLCPPIYG